MASYNFVTGKGEVLELPTNKQVFKVSTVMLSVFSLLIAFIIYLVKYG